MLRTSRGRLVLLLLLAGLAAPLVAHDLFIRPDTFRVPPNATIIVPVLNGTFFASEGAVARDRLADLTIVGPAGRRPLDTDSWTEKNPASSFRIELPAPGTYVLGAATRPTVLAQGAKEFNAYLKEEGLEEVLARRKIQSRLQQPSRERYAKFPKALLQAGDERTDNYGVVLGYDAEIVPLDNPFSLKPGAVLRVRCLVEGKPLANHPVLAGGRRLDKDDHLPDQRLLTDADGVATIKLTRLGDWFVRFVEMREVEGPDANYESRWATLTFGMAGR